MERKNLLLITFDQWRGDWADVYNPVLSLPTLQKISKKGWVARRCYTNCPQCVPSRLSMLSGLMPSQHGVTKNIGLTIPSDFPSIFKKMQNDGWNTTLVGKTHWSNHSLAHDLRENRELFKAIGFDEVIEIAGPRALQKVECLLTDEWKLAGVYDRHIDDLKERYKQGRTSAAWKVKHTTLPNNLYPDLWVTDKAIKKLKEMNTKKPWILWVSYVGPHEPFDTPKPWSGTNKITQLPELRTNGKWIRRLEQDCELSKTYNSWREKLSTNEIVAIREDYADHCLLLDDQVKELISTLEQREDYGDTAILITADHGEMIGDANMLYKSTFLEGSIRVPLIYKPPKRHEPIISQSTNLPILAQGVIKHTLNAIRQNGKISDIRKSMAQKDYIISEYGDEIMVIKNYTKLVLDKHGNLLWGTNTKKDKLENVNILELYKSKDSYSMEIKQAHEIGIEYIKNKEDSNWVWRNLKVNQSNVRS